MAKDGVFYFPADIYPRLGIKPFVESPKVMPPDPANTGTLKVAERNEPMRQGYFSTVPESLDEHHD